MSYSTAEKKQEECKMESIVETYMGIIDKNEEIDINSKENAIEACKKIQKKIKNISYKELLPKEECVEKTQLSPTIEKIKNKMVEIAKQENMSNKMDISSEKAVEKTKKELLDILNIMILYITKLDDEEPA